MKAQNRLEYESVVAEIFSKAKYEMPRQVPGEPGNMSHIFVS